MNKYRALALSIVALLPLLAGCGDAGTTSIPAPVSSVPAAGSTLGIVPDLPSLATPTYTLTSGPASPEASRSAKADATRTPRSFGPTATAVVQQAAPTGTGNNTGGKSVVDVCALLRGADAASILGSPSKEPASTMPAGGPVQGSCNWNVETGDGSVIQPHISLTLYKFPGEMARSYADFVSGLGDAAANETISGLGDEAVWHQTGAGGSLVMRKGSLTAHFIDWKFPREKVETLATAVAVLLP